MIDAALAFAATLGLRHCAAKSVEKNGLDCVVLVEGMLVLNSFPADDADKEAVAAFLSEPFRVRILLSRGIVVKHEWIGVQLS